MGCIHLHTPSQGPNMRVLGRYGQLQGQRASVCSSSCLPSGAGQASMGPSGAAGHIATPLPAARQQLLACDLFTGVHPNSALSAGLF